MIECIGKEAYNTVISELMSFTKDLKIFFDYIKIDVCGKKFLNGLSE